MLKDVIEYAPIDKQYLLDAQKYIERANEYLAEGNAAHCAGCLAKAAKKLHRYNEYNKLMSDDGIFRIIQVITNALAKNVANDILKSWEPS